VKANAMVIKDYEELIEYIATQKPNAKVKFVVKRDGKEIEIEVTILLRPNAEGGFPARGQGGGQGNRGNRPAAAPRALAGFRFGEEGTVISDVTAGSGADKAGLKAKTRSSPWRASPSPRRRSTCKSSAGSQTRRHAQDHRGARWQEDGVRSRAAAAEDPASQILMPGLAPDPSTRGEGEVKVAEVAKGSEAEKGRREVGDIILEVNGKVVSSTAT